MKRAEAEAIIAHSDRESAARNSAIAELEARLLNPAPVGPRRPVALTGEAEYRGSPNANWTLRNQGSSLVLTGYASTFEPYEMWGGPAAGGWIEQLARTAFDKTLRSKPDVQLLVNHEGAALARTKSGTLRLAVDDHGLLVEATLDRSDPDVQALEPKMRRKDMDEMSFAFVIRKQSWAPVDGEPEGLRTIHEVSLHRGDVSVVNFGANPTTTAELARHSRFAGGVTRSARPSEHVCTASKAAQLVAADEATSAARKAAGDAVVARALELLGGSVHAAVDPEAEELRRRGEADAELAQMFHHIEVLDVLGRSTYAARKAYQDAAEEEQQRRRDADEQLERNRRHGAVVSAVKAHRTKRLELQ